MQRAAGEFLNRIANQSVVATTSFAVVMGFGIFGLWSANFYYNAYILGDVSGGFVSNYNPEQLIKTQGGHPVGILLAHIVTASIAFITGFFQFFPAIRRAAPRVHHLLGGIYVVSMLIAGASALVLSWTIMWGPAAISAYSSAAALWLYFLLIGVVTLIKGNYRSHGNFMIRTYAILTLFVTARVMIMAFYDVTVEVQPGAPDPGFTAFYTATIWGLLFVHLAVAETIIAYRSGWVHTFLKMIASTTPTSTHRNVSLDFG